MSIFGSLFGSNNTASTSRTQLEGPAKDAVLDLIGRTTEFANQPYTPYSQPREAGFTQAQNWAFSNASDIAGRAGGLFGDLQNAVYRGAQYGEGVLDPAMAGIIGQNNMLARESGIRAAYGDVPAQQGATIAGQGTNLLAQSVPGTLSLAQRFPDAPIAQYMNPYVQQVLDPAMRDLERRAEQERLNLTDRAIQTGSFGGSRNAIAQGMQQRSTMEEMGRLSANERARAFNEAANQFRLDQQRIPELYNQVFGQMGAAQNLGRNAQQMNAQTLADRASAIQQGLGTQQSISNLANLQNQRYGQMGSLLEGNQNLLQTQVNPLLATGGLQQALNQANLDTMYSDFVEQRDWDRRGIDALIRTLGLAAPTMQTTQTTQQGPRPNAIGQVIGAATGLFGLGRSFGLFRKGGLVEA